MSRGPGCPSCGPVSLLFVDFFDDVRSLCVFGRAVEGGRLVVEEAYFGGGFPGR